MIEKLKTAAWFSSRPSHWAYALELAQRRLRANLDSPACRVQASDWAARRVMSVSQALHSVGLLHEDGQVPTLPPSVVEVARQRAKMSKVTMGGPADLDLLYAAAELSDSRHVIETGVAYGWSSLAILCALDRREGARLVSVDMPYPKEGNEEFVGIVLTDEMKKRWTLIREPDRRGLEKAIAAIGGTIDLCHYDSDKSWWGRQYGYKLLWDALRPGGVFLSDDIQDNLAFAKFVEERSLRFAVTECGGKYVGIARK